MMQTMVPWTGVLISLFVTTICYLWHKLNYWKRMGLPNDRISMYRRFAIPFHAADYEGFLKYGKVVGIYEMFQPVLVVADPILAREVLVNQFQNFGDHRFNGDALKGIGRKMIFNLRREPWKRVRAIASPAFSTMKLKGMIPLIDESIENLTKYVEEIARKNEALNIKNPHCSLTLSILTSCAFGAKVDYLKTSNNPLVENSNKLFAANISWISFLAFNCPSLAPIGSLFGFSIMDSSALSFFQKYITELIIQRRKHPSPTKDFVQLLIDGQIAGEDIQEAKRKLTDEEIVDQGIVFMLAGHESTSTTLSNTVFLLAKNPDVQEKLYQEIKNLTKEESEDYEVLKKLPYLNAVIFESLRIMPAVPRIERRAVADTTLGNIRVKKGTLVTISVYSIHHDPDNFPEPEKFMPERFIEKEANEQAYFAFASGPRNCIGERFAYLVLRLCITKIIRAFKFELCPETKEPFTYCRGSLVTSPTEIVLRPIVRQTN